MIGCGSLLSAFGVRISLTFHLMLVYNILGRFGLVSGHLKELSTRVTIYSLYVLTVDYFAAFFNCTHARWIGRQTL